MHKGVRVRWGFGTPVDTSSTGYKYEVIYNEGTESKDSVGDTHVSLSLTM